MYDNGDSKLYIIIIYILVVVYTCWSKNHFSNTVICSSFFSEEDWLGIEL